MIYLDVEYIELSLCSKILQKGRKIKEKAAGFFQLCKDINE
jgi:hypothetical protein